MSLDDVVLTGFQALFVGIFVLSGIVAAWEHRKARVVQRGITRTAILRTNTSGDRHGLIDDLAHAVRHHESATQAQWALIAAGVILWWLW